MIRVQTVFSYVLYKIGNNCSSNNCTLFKRPKYKINNFSRIKKVKTNILKDLKYKLPKEYVVNTNIRETICSVLKGTYSQDVRPPFLVPKLYMNPIWTGLNRFGQIILFFKMIFAKNMCARWHSVRIVVDYIHDP